MFKWQKSKVLLSTIKNLWSGLIKKFEKAEGYCLKWNFIECFCKLMFENS